MANPVDTVGITNNARLLSAANSDNATVISTVSVRLFTFKGVSHAGATRYVKTYNLARLPTSADTPVETIEIPANNAFDLNWTSKGLLYPTGLAFRIVTGSADNDNTSVAAGDLTSLNFGYA